MIRSPLTGGNDFLKLNRMRITVLACPPLDSVTTDSVPLKIHLNSKNSRIAWPRGRPTSSCHRTCHVQSTCHASASTRHASASTCHAHKPLAYAMAFVAEHLPQCLAACHKAQHLPSKSTRQLLSVCSLSSCSQLSSHRAPPPLAANHLHNYAPTLGRTLGVRLTLHFGLCDSQHRLWPCHGDLQCTLCIIFSVYPVRGN